MSTSPRDDLEYFEDLDDLIIEQGDSADQSAKSCASSSIAGPTRQELKAQVPPSGRSGKIRNRDPEPSTKKRSRLPSEEEVCGFLSDSTDSARKQEMRVVHEATVMQLAGDPETVERHQSSSLSRPIRSRAEPHAVKPRQTSIRGPLSVIAAMLTVAGVGWYLSARSGEASSPMVEGTLRFEGPTPPVAFIKLLKLNSPIEEGYVSEIQNGRFTFSAVSAGDYAMWLEEADGTPVPVRPVGKSVGLLEEAEHHLRLSVSSDGSQFQIEVAVRKGIESK